MTSLLVLIGAATLQLLPGNTCVEEVSAIYLVDRDDTSSETPRPLIVREVIKGPVVVTRIPGTEETDHLQEPLVIFIDEHGIRKNDHYAQCGTTLRGGHWALPYLRVEQAPTVENILDLMHSESPIDRAAAGRLVNRLAPTELDAWGQIADEAMRLLAGRAREWPVFERDRLYGGIEHAIRVARKAGLRTASGTWLHRTERFMVRVLRTAMGPQAAHDRTQACNVLLALGHNAYCREGPRHSFSEPNERALQAIERRLGLPTPSADPAESP